MDSRRSIIEEEPVNIMNQTVTELDYDNNEDLLSMLQDPLQHNLRAICQNPVQYQDDLHCPAYEKEANSQSFQQQFPEIFQDQMLSFDFDKYVEEILANKAKAKICQDKVDAEVSNEFLEEAAHNTLVNMKSSPSTQTTDAENAMASEELLEEADHNNLVNMQSAGPSARTTNAENAMASGEFVEEADEEVDDNTLVNMELQIQKSIVEKFMEDSWINLLNRDSEADHSNLVHMQSSPSAQTTYAGNAMASEEFFENRD